MSFHWSHLTKTIKNKFLLYFITDMTWTFSNSLTKNIHPKDELMPYDYYSQSIESDGKYNFE